ncbi:Type II secretion system protein F [Prochlorococcus marinus str. MIT 1313]|uniref:type II secretion system F family protein n=1 Tax=Prochlorococcus TaxID=1218 RepID=UPI0007B3E3FA|nr:type II secretion system F family protein [Prochlorococcus marinus]KZR68741.1 Type II secretion system protein F [Prochlorococcus marinus str. MIT 1313]
MAEYGAASLPQQSAQNISGANQPSMTAASMPQISPKRLTIPQKDLLVFFRQLAVVLQSGVSLAQGLVLIGENMTNKKFRACIVAIAARLNAGEDLSFCLKQYPKVFAPITVGLIEAGEVGGILDQVLERIALLLEEQAKLKGQIIGALIYPAIVLLLAVTVSLGLLIGIVPKFELMFSNMGSELPALTKLMLTLSEFVTTPGFAIGAPVTIFVGIFLFRGFYASKEGRIAVDTGIFAVPLFGDLILRSEMAALCDTLSTLVTSGIPLVDSLQRCMSASSNQLIKNTIQLGIQLVREGQELNYAFNQSKIMPRLVVSMIKIGEETGELSFMLEKLSDFYKREVESTVSALTKAMEPAIIFVVAGIVGTIVIALYLPMFSMIKAMKGG